MHHLNLFQIRIAKDFFKTLPPVKEYNTFIKNKNDYWHVIYYQSSYMTENNGDHRRISRILSTKQLINDEVLEEMETKSARMIASERHS